MTGALLALAASLLWGGADFLGGRATRGTPVLTVVLVSQGAGLLALAVVLAVRGGVDLPAAAWGAGAGVVGALSVTAFYRALALGTMGVVAPIAATSAVVPVLVALAGGERPSVVASAGMAVAFAGVLLASRAPSAPGAPPPVDHRRSTLLAVAAAVLLGLQLLLLDRAGETDALTGVAASRLVSVLLFLVVVVATRARVRGAARGDLAVVGLLDTGANLAFATATGHGLLSLVAVLASLYPVVTTALARVRLAERLSRTQGVGAVLALGGVLLVVSG